MRIVPLLVPHAFQAVEPAKHDGKNKCGLSTLGESQLVCGYFEKMAEDP